MSDAVVRRAVHRAFVNDEDDDVIEAEIVEENEVERTLPKPPPEYHVADLIRILDGLITWARVGSIVLDDEILVRADDPQVARHVMSHFIDRASFQWEYESITRRTTLRWTVIR